MDTPLQLQTRTLHPADDRTITITERERQFLMEVLQPEIAELRSENYHAESHDVKELIKERERCAKHLMEVLQHGDVL